VTKDPASAADELDRYQLPADTSGITFTIDRSLFPPLFGMPPEEMFGPEIDVVLVVYSEGWGVEDAGAALLFFARNDAGMYEWYGMVVGPAHFDM
jgi:hypothetical protein